MTLSARVGLPAALAVAALALYACTAADPNASTDAVATPTAAQASGARAQNAKPRLIVKTNPAATAGVISGIAPLTVMFNLCPSDDADAGDSLNWQFWFGDGRPATAAPDYDQFCRIEHTYERPGTFVVTLSVTDKHAEDQSRSVSSMARETTTLTVQAGQLNTNGSPTLACSSVTPPAIAGRALAISGSVRCVFGDPDGDPLTWSASVGSANHVFAPSSGSVAPSAFGTNVVLGTVTWNCSGPNSTSVTITASDGKGGAASQTIGALSGICID